MIFERFVRVDDARGQSTGGSGLGLAITREIIERHGGTVEVDTVPRSGARFVVTIPTQVNRAQVAVGDSLERGYRLADAGDRGPREGLWRHQGPRWLLIHGAARAACSVFSGPTGPARPRPCGRYSDWSQPTPARFPGMANRSARMSAFGSAICPRPGASTRR